MLRFASKRFLRTSVPKKTVEFSNFVKSELALEQESSLAADFSDLKNAGFSLKTAGARVEISKNVNANKLAHVSWSVNGSVPDMNATEEEQEPVSYPDFTIEVEKKNYKKVVQYECFFPDDIPEEEALDFAVRSVSVVDKSQGSSVSDADFEAYYINTDNIDPETYSQIRKYLSDIGFDQQFGDMLIDYSTGYEGDQYLQQLSEVAKFLDA